MLLQTEAQIKKVETLSDRSLKLTIYTQELDATAKAILFELQNKLGWMVFKETAIEEQDIPTAEIKLEGSYKSPSERLRNVLYRIWENGSQKEPFNTHYYPRIMNTLIETYKDRLA